MGTNVRSANQPPNVNKPAPFPSAGDRKKNTQSSCSHAVHMQECDVFDFSRSFNAVKFLSLCHSLRTSGSAGCGPSLQNQF